MALTPMMLAAQPPPLHSQMHAGTQVLPLATGMALTLTLLAAAARRGPEARHVIWSRIDQKTCLKAITAANLVGSRVVALLG